MEMNMFNIGDTVATKQIGFPAAGTIVFIFDCTYYRLVHRVIDNKRWSQICPDWKQKEMVCIKVNTPMRPLRFEEFVEDNPDIREDLRQAQYDGIAAGAYHIYPYDDLELIE